MCFYTLLHAHARLESVLFTRSVLFKRWGLSTTCLESDVCKLTLSEIAPCMRAMFVNEKSKGYVQNMPQSLDPLRFVY